MNTESVWIRQWTGKEVYFKMLKQSLVLCLISILLTTLINLSNEEGIVNLF